MSGTAPKPPVDNLGHRASRGIAVTMGGLWSKTAIQTVSTVVLARLLDPADFGLLAMVTAITGIADLVRDFGMTGSIINARKMSDEIWRSVLWFSVALGTVLMIIVAASAPLIADLYGEPRLVLLTLVISPGLLLNGIAMPMQARATRDLRFGALANIDIVSTAVGVACSIAAGLAGWGVWSLVVMAGGSGLSRLAMLWVVAKPKFGRPHISRKVIPILTTGGNIFGNELLNYAERNLDNVIVGYQFGAAVLGQYSRAYSLFLLPLQQMNGPIGRVALPVLSKLRDDPDRYRRYIRGAVLVIGYLTLPTYAIAAAVSPSLISLLLGPGWSQAATIFSILSIAGFVQAITKVRGWLYITLGRSHRQFMYDLVTRPMVVAGFFAGAWVGGVYGVALLYGLLTLALLVPGFFFAIRGTFVRASDIVLPVLRPAALAFLAYGAALGATMLVDLPTIGELAVGIGAGLVPFAIALAFPAYRGDLRQMVDFVLRMRKSKKVVEKETPELDVIDDAVQEAIVDEVELETPARIERAQDGAPSDRKSQP
jgi:PST family polysaccharide transporter